MRPLRYSINVTLDGCIDHQVMPTDEELQDLRRHHAQNLAQADALIYSRVTYEMMEEAWRPFLALRYAGEWSSMVMPGRYVAAADIVNEGSSSTSD